MNSTFRKDLKIEHEIAKYLDKHLYTEPTFSKCIRPDYLDSQHKGIDIILSSSDFNIYDAKVDEKCTSHYVNCDITTFAFELLYIKDGYYKTGWFLDNQKETEYYTLIWPFANPETEKGRFDSLTEDCITVSIRLRTTCIFDSKLKATCSSWPKLGKVDSTWFVLPTCLAGVHGELHGCSRSRVSGAGHPPSIHVD